ncbi:MAG TPA: FAD-dependent oxidoreductase [Candidatus Limnocylindrales bacterium]
MTGRPVSRIAVIGGGIVGTTVAALIAERGVDVSLYEREALAAGASGRNSGVVQRPFDPALHDLYARSFDLYRRLEAEQLGFVLASEPSGLLLVSRDEALVRAFATNLAATSPDLVPVVATGAALLEIEPTLAPDLAACRLELGFPVVPASGTYAFATLAERHGARIHLGRTVALSVDRGRATGVAIDGRYEAADAVVVAAGPWTPDILDPTLTWRPIRAQWGVVVETILALPPRHVMEEAELDAALGTPDRPSADDAGAGVRELGFSLVTAAGVSCVGSTFLEEEPVPEEWEVPLLDHAASFVPAIADAPIRGVRACARPASLDGRPLIGRVPWIEHCFVASGHGPWGISTGPGSAQLIVELMFGGPDASVPAPLDVARFGAPAG